MDELSRHIESLLLNHDCVAIPHFGSFVTMRVPAAYSAEEELFYPPMRSVRFNEEMKADDGLLTRSITQTYGCKEQDARTRVQTLVLQLRQQLLADGQADFGILGQFTQDEDGQITFEACQAGVVTPLFYGLDSFTFPRLSTASKAKATQKAAQRASEAAEEAARNSVLAIRHNSAGITIHIGHSFIRATSLVAAIILLFFVLPTQNTSVSSPTTMVASVLPIPTEKEHIATTAVTEAMEENVLAEEEELPVTTEEPASAVIKEEAPTATGNDTEAYVVVIASAITQANAARYVEELSRRGMDNARIIVHGKMVRVVLGGYASEEDATERARQLHHQGDEFANAWVMSTK